MLRGMAARYAWSLIVTYVTLQGVRQALERLSEHLRRKGATVRMVYLPAAAGKKIGVDDFLVAGHTLQDLEALIEAPRPQPQPAPSQVELLDEAPACYSPSPRAD